MSDKIQLSVRAQTGGCVVSANEYDLFTISNDIPDSEHYPLNKFYVTLCRTGNVSEIQSFAIKLRGEEKNSLGYCFPINAFGNAEAFEGKWRSVYGRAAFSFLTQSQMLRAALSDDTLKTLKGGEVGVRDIYDCDLSVMVLGREALDRFGISDTQLPLMLARQGICATDPSDNSPCPPIFKTWTSSVSLSPTSEEFRDEEILFWQLIRMAARSGWESGSFLILYQCLEFSIQRVFDWGMVNISPPGISTWDLKERLMKLINEQFRLNALNSYCLGGKIDAEILESVKSECRATLSAIGDSVEKHTSWVSALYALRNLVIHNQIRLMRRSDVSLREVNIALTRLCLEIIGSLSRPGEVGIWSSTGMAATGMPEVDTETA
ncbi:hypothetical protein V5F49_19285 [Xanthobacter sp. V3C-3]|uniref:hypothetical protein n=1 Tax=Xanthobacter lutulentifluminis TaxID=3119935 RepID=UPI00372A3FD4